MTREVFAGGGHDWAVCFYPCGKNTKDSKYLSPFVALMSEALGVREGIVGAQAGGPEREREDRSGNENHPIYPHFDPNPCEGPAHAHEPGKHVARV